MKLLATLIFGMGISIVPIQSLGATFSEVYQHFRSNSDFQANYDIAEYMESGFAFINRLQKQSLKGNYTTHNLIKLIQQKPLTLSGLTPPEQAFLIRVPDVMGKTLLESPIVGSIPHMQNAIEIYIAALESGKIQFILGPGETFVGHSLPGLGDDTIGMTATQLMNEFACLVEQDLRNSQGLTIGGSMMINLENNMAQLLAAEQIPDNVSETDPEFLEEFVNYYQGTMPLYIITTVEKSRILVEKYAAHAGLAFTFGPKG